MKFKYHRWFQWLVVPFVALAFHIYFGYRIIGRENIPEGGCVVCPNHISCPTPRSQRSHSVTGRRCA